MNRLLLIAGCFSVHYICAVVTLDRTGKKSEIAVSSAKDEVPRNNPHMPTMIRPTENRNLMTQHFADKNIKEVFTEIYKTNFWLGPQSLSGQGSSIATTRTIREELPRLFDALKINRIVDLGCGDFYWMQTIDLSNKFYIGIDIVPEMIQLNRTHFGNERRHFLCLDVTKDSIPQADMIICRDVIAHLDYQNVCNLLRNAQASGSTFLLMTTHIDQHNRSIACGHHCQYDVTKAPFNLPEPLILIEEIEAEPETLVQKKAMGLWLLRDLNLDCLEY